MHTIIRYSYFMSESAKALQMSTKEEESEASPRLPGHADLDSDPADEFVILDQHVHDQTDSKCKK